MIFFEGIERQEFLGAVSTGVPCDDRRRIDCSGEFEGGWRKWISAALQAWSGIIMAGSCGRIASECQGALCNN